jgi:hypothetical protein
VEGDSPVSPGSTSAAKKARPKLPPPPTSLPPKVPSAYGGPPTSAPPPPPLEDDETLPSAQDEATAFKDRSRPRWVDIHDAEDGLDAEGSGSSDNSEAFGDSSQIKPRGSSQGRWSRTAAPVKDAGQGNPLVKVAPVKDGVPVARPGAADPTTRPADKSGPPAAGAIPAKYFLSPQAVPRNAHLAAEVRDEAFKAASAAQKAKPSAVVVRQRNRPAAADAAAA